MELRGTADVSKPRAPMLPLAENFQNVQAAREALDLLIRSVVDFHQPDFAPN
jgi:hypothetical protein